MSEIRYGSYGWIELNQTSTILLPKSIMETCSVGFTFESVKSRCVTIQMKLQFDAVARARNFP